MTMTMMTPVIPPMPRIPCPTWCANCEDSCTGANGRPLTCHTSEGVTVPVAMHPDLDGAGDIRAYLDGYNGEPPRIELLRENLMARFSIEEAEQLAGVLASLVAQARATQFR